MRKLPAASPEDSPHTTFPSNVAALPFLEPKMFEMCAPDAPTKPRRKSYKGKSKQKEALQPYAHLLGTVPDSEVAWIAGVDEQYVWNYRQTYGIKLTCQNLPTKVHPVVPVVNEHGPIRAEQIAHLLGITSWREISNLRVAIARQAAEGNIARIARGLYDRVEPAND